MHEMLYDPKCHELATHFLGDDEVAPDVNERRIQSLAQAIQEAVEDWIADEEDRIALFRDRV